MAIESQIHKNPQHRRHFCARCSRHSFEHPFAQDLCNEAAQERLIEKGTPSDPLVLNYRTMYRQAIKEGAFGKWLHLELATPADIDIVTPNVDTPYSWAWVDLRAEPWVLTMPKIDEGRYYVSQTDHTARSLSLKNEADPARGVRITKCT